MDELPRAELLDRAEKFGTWDLIKPQHKESFESSSYEDVQKEINTIQSQQETTKTMMNMNRIQSFLTGMAQFEKVLKSIEFQHTAKVMAYVWGPARFLLKTTSINSRAFDNVLDGYEQLGRNIPPLNEYTKLFTELPESEGCLLYIYEDVLAFHRLAYELFSLRDSLWRDICGPTWAALNHTLKHLADSLKSHQLFITTHGSSIRNLQAGPSQDAESMFVESWPEVTQRWSAAKMEFDRYRDDLNGRRNNFKADERNRNESQKQSVLKWISASNETPSLHKKLQEMRICDNTGRWLFRKYSDVNDWMKEDQPPESAVWLHGNKGFGKTVLASLLVDELEDLCTKTKLIPPDSKTYYFYCQEGDPELCTSLGILKGILHQMVDAEGYLLPFCAEKSASGGSVDLATVQTLMEAFFEYSSRQYVIIDGIDECDAPEIRQAADFLMKQVTKCDNQIRLGQLRLLFMSQPMPELAKEKFMPVDDAYVALKPKDNADDIRSYVKKRIPEFSEKRATESGFNLSEGDTAQIESIVCSRSEDMFLYAHLAIDYLLQQPTKEKLLEKLNEEMVPKKLSEIYEKLLGAVKDELLQLGEGEAHWEMAKLLLGWLVCAKRPLKWHEMQAILSYDPVKRKVDFDKKMLRQHVGKYLGSLVHILDGDHIRIIHSTARHHVIQNEHINEQEVQCELAIRCLTYLSLPCFSKGYSEDERRKKAQLGWFSFQDYACSQWHSHVYTTIMECSNLFLDRREDYEEKFGFAVKCFIDTHRADLTTTTHPDLQDPHDILPRFKGFSFYNDIRSLWKHIYSHQKGTFDVRNTVGIAQLEDALRENRITLEKGFTPRSVAWNEDTIEDYYGPNLFKCKRTLCKFFYLGYDKKKDRDTHDDRHDRPYQCPANCNLAPMGFSSKKDKDRHVRIYHPDLIDGPSIFEALSRRVGPQQYACKMCDKKFTRNDTLKGHQRSHFNERPYACSKCNRAFARVNDCRRHEKTIHLRRGA